MWIFLCPFLKSYPTASTHNLQRKEPGCTSPARSTAGCYLCPLGSKLGHGKELQYVLISFYFYSECRLILLIYFFHVLLCFTFQLIIKWPISPIIRTNIWSYLINLFCICQIHKWNHFTFLNICHAFKASKLLLVLQCAERKYVERGEKRHI